MVVYCIPSLDVLGMVCFTRDSQDTWTGEYGCILYTILACIWDGLFYRDSQDTWTGGYGCILCTILGCTWDGVCYMYLGFSRYLDRVVWLYTVYHPWMYLGWRVLPGILKILGQGGMAVYCIPSWDVIGMA